MPTHQRKQPSSFNPKNKLGLAIIRTTYHYAYLLLRVRLGPYHPNHLYNLKKKVKLIIKFSDQLHLSLLMLYHIVLVKYLFL